MHLIESLSHFMKMVPVVNEVATTIATEYFNEANLQSGKKALALVTAGPGLTNAITGIAGAYLESRELLIIGGQVKTSDLSDGSVRQSGIQEINGIEIVSGITCRSVRISSPVSKDEFQSLITFQKLERKGPIFLEFCLDVQAKNVNPHFSTSSFPKEFANHKVVSEDLNKVSEAVRLLNDSKRPVFLLGSGFNIHKISKLLELINKLGIPIMTSWNAADRVAHDFPFFFGRPNNWGQRSSNIILQQSDLLIAAGTRLGFQSTGFNFEEFLPVGKLIHIDIDENEIYKGHPSVELGIVADACDTALRILNDTTINLAWLEWVEFCKEVSGLVPLLDPENTASIEYVEIFKFVNSLSTLIGDNDIIIPGSSGGGSTVTMQVIEQKGLPQRIITNKGMASMGYGICGAIGAAFSGKNRVWLFDGDGSLTQNSQEFGVYAQFNLDIKAFIISNNGYASIRSTQKNYFSGNYIGCDPSTGLNLPNWKLLADAYGIDHFRVNVQEPLSTALLSFLSKKGPGIIEIPVDPNQTFYPKITSRISESKGMESNPLHLMTPELSPEIAAKVFRFISH